ncbi:MAG: malate synthase A [Thermoleophilia bacterium]
MSTPPPATPAPMAENRWDGIERPYGPADVERLRGSVQVEHTLARLGSERLWRLLQERPYVHALGAQTGAQAVQMVRAGLEAIYLSGWQVAADANLAGQTFPDQSLYPANSAPQLVRRINNALLRADRIDHAEGTREREWLAPIVADAEAGFGGPLNAFELMTQMIEAGAAGVHFEDQLAAEKKCGHLGGKVLVPTSQFIRTLVAARLAADVAGVPTVLVARTDSLAATLLTSDIDERDVEFTTGERTPEGFFLVRPGIESAIARGLAYAPFADLIWCETGTPDLGEAREFAQAIHREFPGKLLAYNCSPSFNWRRALDDDEIARFQRELGELGYRFQFITLAGWHANNAAMFELASGYREGGMSAYVKLQQREFALEEHGYTATRHQREAGAGWFDQVLETITGGEASTLALRARPRRSSSDGAHARGWPIRGTSGAGRERRRGRRGARRGDRAVERGPTPAALAFVATLQREFGARREQLLAARAERQARLDAGELPGFLPGTAAIREGDWQVAPMPAGLADRRVEITGPVDRKMVINALNSGARVFMADFEDANSPTWANCVDGQGNLADAIRRTIRFESPDGRVYELSESPAELLVRPRGWHLPEKHVLVDGRPISGSLLDFGLYLFHNGQELLDRGRGPWFYLPKLEGHLEARLWNDVFVFAQDALGLPRGSIKATVLIETILAAFEMDEILYELREHSIGLNAGRWDYIFSMIKKLRAHPAYVLPDRAQVTMTVPFMRAYTELLVQTCHRRGAFAMGGMAAFIPSRRDAEVNERALSRVREDKVREATDGFDGTWVAHPDLVPVAAAVFDEILGERPNQLARQRPEVSVAAGQLLDTRIEGGSISEAGLRTNVAVGIEYVESWLRGNGAAALYNLMEDAATAEISRSQVWQWVRHGATLDDGRTVTADLVRGIVAEEMARLGDGGRFPEARAIFEGLALADDFPEFLTLPAYAAL